MQGVQLDVQETENGALLSFSITGSMSVPEAASAPQEDTPSTSEPQDAAADARRGLLALLQALPGISTEDRVRLQEMQAKLDPAQAAQEVPGSSGAPGEDAGTLDAAQEAGSSAELGDGAHEDAEVGTYHVEWPWLGRDETTLDNMERVKADILMLDRNRCVLLLRAGDTCGCKACCCVLLLHHLFSRMHLLSRLMCKQALFALERSQLALKPIWLES